MWDNPKMGGCQMCQQHVKGLQFFNRNHGGHPVVLLCWFLPPWSLYSQTRKIKQKRHPQQIDQLLTVQPSLGLLCI